MDDIFEPKGYILILSSSCIFLLLPVRIAILFFTLSTFKACLVF